ncbi:hypothetical protein ACHHYP_16910 [Achlya hypogyna]|uniref:RING-type domain-containing protein n=1 Tax=Achlya hypogyna TaxID=1202772 RepID=A0A1V9ZDW6_ACHHY|nr:hypothetical protein ACHHYP_16910 [Achlya hypogyna]
MIKATLAPALGVETVSRRADIRRAASLRDVDVSVFPLEADDGRVFSWRAQYEVALENRPHELYWKFYTTYAHVKRFLQCVCAIAKRTKCTHLRELRAETQRLLLRAWFQDKAPVIAHGLSLVLTTVAAHAAQVATCRAHREVLHLTTSFCVIEIPLDIRACQLMRLMTTLDAAPAFDDDCCICLSAEAAPRVALKCGHVFHETCICVWYYSRLNCPICRQ